MDFFKSVFSDDPEPADPQNTPPSSPNSQSDPQNHHHPDPTPTPSPSPKPSISSITNAWSFGGLIKTLASKSESVIETYKRDLEEFSSGLRKETAVIREAASRAVKDLPTSLEAGAAAAQESLESVGQAIDNIGNTVSEIISQGKDSILDNDSDSEMFDSKHISSSSSSNNQNKPYSRIDAQIRGVQCDLNTYCKEPEEDLEEYNEWKLRFNLDEMGGEIEDLIEENGVIEEIYNEVVPGTVDRESFWSRYFFRVYKVRKVEEARVKLVKRVISRDDEEVLSWDVDDDDYEASGGSKSKDDLKEPVQEKEDAMENAIDDSKVESEDKSLTSENNDVGSKSDSGVDERVHLDNVEEKSDEKLGSEGKAESGGSCKDSDFSVVSSQPSMPEEEDLGWDEIEDIGSTDEIKATASGSPNRADLRKRLSAMEEEEEEDLGWDIEDDDEPVVKS
ncbi:BSD domain-containing protein 1-like [Camellia sinensis]|uniref:BSD domain-containing protein 1-like n=1 Tax=Camellia sinensis TaxID=4442 RepID=UPI0010355856|nr:BSD domain-containing protein 1-like [Camellia sinensis]